MAAAEDEMITVLLKNIYSRIAQLGKAIQGLKGTLDDLNQNIEDKTAQLTNKLTEFSEEIEITQTKHLEVLDQIGEGATKEMEKLQAGLGLEAFEGMIENLKKFSEVASDVLNQDTVNLLLSETIDSVKTLKASVIKPEEE
jgi:predicted  nucleic acid-binding Zn-ribbon protein